MATYTFDTSAVIAHLREEPGGERVRELLRAARDGDDVHIYVPFIAIMEMQYKFMRDLPAERVRYWTNVVTNWPVEVVESSLEWSWRAAEVKSAGRLSLADAWVASLALTQDSELVHKDPEFESVDRLRDIKLPYDRDVA
jgi:uncharacterized protein